MYAEQATPIKEIPLDVLHKRSAPLGISKQRLAQGLDGTRRLDAFKWLLQAFDACSFSDTELFGAFSLLDRYCAASLTTITGGSGAFALVLASMTIALKGGGTPGDLERGKRLVLEVLAGQSEKPWEDIRHAELRILRQLRFRVCAPTARDILERLLEKLFADTNSFWDSGTCQSVADLSRFLLELGLVHEPEAVYGTGCLPLTAALGAVFLAYLAFDAPRQCIEALKDPLKLLDQAGPVEEFVHAVGQRWIAEEKIVTAGTTSVVIEKWLRRMGTYGFGASPPDASDLQQLPCLIHELWTATNFEESASYSKQGCSSHSKKGSSFRNSENNEPNNLVPSIESLPFQRSGLPALKHSPALAQLPKIEVTEKLPSARGFSQQGLGLSSPIVRRSKPCSRILNVTARAEECSPEAVFDITDVLSYVKARPAANPVDKPCPGTLNAVRQREPLVTEWFISEALRIQWPEDQCKVGADAAASCRETAAMFHEAAQQLLGVASALESGKACDSKLAAPLRCAGLRV